MKLTESKWNYMKNKFQEAHATNIQTLKKVSSKLWIHMGWRPIFEVGRTHAY